MKSDITRDTFVAGKHYSRVIRQQGRVDLDADINEQTSILLHYLRTLALDLIGPYAAPVMAAGFRLSRDTNDGLSISAGRYYVDGYLVENETSCLYTEQPNPLPKDDPFAKALIDKLDALYWVYLDLWERHITSIEDDSIREKALGGPDTCSRAQVAWQVRALDVGDTALADKRKKRREWLTNKLTTLQTQLNSASSALTKARLQQEIDRVKDQLAIVDKPKPEDLASGCAFPLDYLLPVSDASMGARVDPGAQIVDACVTSPDSKFTGPANQLYRVEVHRGGLAGEATIKWSRNNGSQVAAWTNSVGFDLEVANARDFVAGNWVELSDDVSDLRGLPGVLARLTKVDGATLTVDPDSVGGDPNAIHWNNDLINPKVRRWDHFETEDTVLEDDGSILIKETPIGTPDDTAGWMDLEDGIQIQFAAGGEYRTGDYWLIPARVATGNIEWPDPDSDTIATFTTLLAPNGVVHHYAPLGFASWPAAKLHIDSCNCEFEPLSSCFSSGSIAVAASLLRNGQLLFREDRLRASTASAQRARTTTTDRTATKTAATRRSTKKGGT